MKSLHGNKPNVTPETNNLVSELHLVADILIFRAYMRFYIADGGAANDIPGHAA